VSEIKKLICNDAKFSPLSKELLHGFADQLIRIFCDIDEFCKEFDTYAKHKLLSDPSKNSELGLLVRVR
jgi:hypothetical protein